MWQRSCSPEQKIQGLFIINHYISALNKIFFHFFLERIAELLTFESYSTLILARAK